MDYRIEQLRYRLREDPDSRVFYQLGEILRREGSLDESIRVLEQGLAHHPRYVAAWVALGRALAADDRGGEAEKAFARALELDPENSVAARSIGEIAVRRSDWVRAVKAFKLARVLSPGDTTLEERIAEVERRLAEAGMLERPPVRVAPAVAVSRRVRPPATVVCVSDDDPFAVSSAGDTGVFVVADDVFSSPVEAESPEAPAPPAASQELEEGHDGEPLPSALAAESAAGPEAAGPERVEAAAVPLDEERRSAEPVVGEDRTPVDDDVVAEQVAGTREVAVDEVVEAAATPAAPPEADLDTVHEPAPAVQEPGQLVHEVAAEAAYGDAWEESQEDYPEDAYPADDDDGGAAELPLPTMTLARLALQQGDRELAQHTLVGVLERDPGHDEARSMLVSLRAAAAEPVVTARVAADAGARAAALQGWLDTIRLAAENRRR